MSKMNKKYIFVTGGVVSGLGKGITAASLGRLLKNRGYKVVNQKKSYKTAIILSIAFIIIVLLFLLFSTIFALITSNKSTIINGVSIKDIDVSNLTKEQALEKISNEFSKKSAQAITLKHNAFEQTILPEQFEVSFSLNDAINIAYSKGRSRKYLRKQL